MPKTAKKPGSDLLTVVLCVRILRTMKPPTGRIPNPDPVKYPNWDNDTPEWMDRLHTERHPCQLCHWCERERSKVIAYLKLRGITESEAGENTIRSKNDIAWGPVIEKLDLLALCTIPSKSGNELVHKAATCQFWKEDTGRIWEAVSRTAKKLIVP